MLLHEYNSIYNESDLRCESRSGRLAALLSNWQGICFSEWSNGPGVIACLVISANGTIFCTFLVSDPTSDLRSDHVFVSEQVISVRHVILVYSLSVSSFLLVILLSPLYLSSLFLFLFLFVFDTFKHSSNILLNGTQTYSPLPGGKI